VLADVDPYELLDRLTECVAAYDREGRFTYANAASARLFGKPAADLVGQHPWDVMHSPPGTRFRQALEEVLALPALRGRACRISLAAALVRRRSRLVRRAKRPASRLGRAVWPAMRSEPRAGRA
jgi:PAS domain-containing protein